MTKSEGLRRDPRGKPREDICQERPVIFAFEMEAAR